MKKASSAPLFATLTLFLTGSVLLNKDLYACGKDVLPVLSLAACIATVLFTIVMFPFLKYPYLRPEDLFRLKAGKSAKKLFLVAMLLFCFFSALSVYSDCLRFISAVALDATPDLLASAVISAFILCISLTGPRAVFPVATTVFIIFLAFFAAVLFEGYSEIRIETLLPIFSHGAFDSLAAAIKLSFGFLCDVFIAVMLVGREADGHRLYKTAICSLAAVLFSVAALGLLPAALFGESMTVFDYPVFQALCTLKNVSFLPKWGFLFAVFIFLITVIKVSLLCAFTGRSLSLMTGSLEKGKRRLIFCALPLLFITLFSHYDLSTAGSGFFQNVITAKSALSASLPVMFLLVLPLKYKSGHSK